MLVCSHTVWRNVFTLKYLLPHSGSFNRLRYSKIVLCYIPLVTLICTYKHSPYMFLQLSGLQFFKIYQILVSIPPFDLTSEFQLNLLLRLCKIM